MNDTAKPLNSIAAADFSPLNFFFTAPMTGIEKMTASTNMAIYIGVSCCMNIAVCCELPLGMNIFPRNFTASERVSALKNTKAVTVTSMV